MHLTLHLTKNCNMRCSYCYAQSFAGCEMDADTVRKTVAFASGISDGNTGLVFFGGEPLLRKDLICAAVEECEKVEQASSGTFHFKVSTNGLLLDQEFLTFAQKNRVHVAMSIDGVRYAHDRHRVDSGGKGTFSRVVKKAKLLLEYQPYASALMVVTPETVALYAESVRYLFSIGFKYIISSVNYAGKWTDGHIETLGKEYEKLAEMYEQMIVEERKFYFSPFERVLSSHIRGKEYARCNRCALGMRQLSVAPDGKLFPCIQFVRDEKFSIGDIGRGIDETRRNSLYSRSRESLTPCTECDYENRCENRCSCLNWQTTGTLTDISPVLCETERVLIPVVDRLGKKLFEKKNPMFIQKHYNAAYPYLSLFEDSSYEK